MDLCEFLKNNIKIEKINQVEEKFREIAIVRYVMKEISRLFYRDYTFFLNKENIKERYILYNKENDLHNIHDFSIVCKSYCLIIQELLNEYGIEAELISPFNDDFKHVDLLIKTKNGNKYIVDPLTDLIEMQTGLRTNNFTSKQYYESSYTNVLDNISFLTEQELEQIDEKIDYKNGSNYLDETLMEIKNSFENIENFLEKNPQIAIDLTGHEYNGKPISEDEKIELKLKYIFKYLNNRKYLNGFVDLIMFSNTVIDKLFSPEEQRKIHTYNFFVDENDLKNRELSNVIADERTRKRGRVISFNGRNYIFSLNNETLEYNDKMWKEIVEKNNIFIKPEYRVQLLKYLKINGADRNIVHNNEFRRLFNKFETSLLSSGKDIEDIKKENIIIQDGMIITKTKDNYILFKIEDGNLVIKDYAKNQKHIIFYEDEGRNISKKTEPILRDNQKAFLYEFDSNGLFKLEDISGIENLVAPLKNGKYLSRNASFYEANTYSELAQQRQKLRDILTEDCSKRNLVIVEYLSNSSAKVYFEELKKKIENKENNAMQARKCLEEDCDNIVRFFKNQPLLKPTHNLIEGEDRVLDRHIEMDNKQILYLFCSNLKFKNPKHVITPGLGSIMVGPILKSMYGFDYTNILFSLYSKDEKLRNMSEQKDFEELFSDDNWIKTPNMLLLIDDNVGSCNTMNTIRKQLNERGKQCKFGAIKYNWNFYKQVKHGELDHPTFDIHEVDFLTILDDPGYWIMRDSIKALKEEGGEAYVEVMKKEGLLQEDKPDIHILMQLAERYSQDAQVNLYDMESGNIKKSSAFLCNKLREQILEIIRESKIKDRS